jgi:hypothetical protein
MGGSIHQEVVVYVGGWLFPKPQYFGFPQLACIL